MSETLRRCMCGEKATLRTNHSVGGMGGTGYYIKCTDLINCGLSTDVWQNTDGLIAAWNTRPVEDALLEACKAALAQLMISYSENPDFVATKATLILRAAIEKAEATK